MRSRGTAATSLAEHAPEHGSRPLPLHPPGRSGKLGKLAVAGQKTYTMFNAYRLIGHRGTSSYRRRHCVGTTERCFLLPLSLRRRSLAE